MLEIRDLEITYGAIRAVRGVSLEVREREIVTLVGNNGAGKSSTLNAVAGLVRLSDRAFVVVVEVLITGLGVLFLVLPPR